MRILIFVSLTFWIHLVSAQRSLAQSDSSTIWNSSPIEFVKQDGADHTLEENQDRITDTVWLTRSNRGGIFNIVTQTSFSNPGPEGTKWAIGTTDNLEELNFVDWRDIMGRSQGANLLSNDLVLHILEENIYIDIKFTQWSVGNQGGQGGFAYTRATEPSTTTSVNELSSFQPQKTQLFQNYPNPFNPSTTIRFELTESQDVKLEVVALDGRVVEVLVDAKYNAGNHIINFDASSLATGVYVYRLRTSNQVLYRKMTLMR